MRIRIAAVFICALVPMAATTGATMAATKLAPAEIQSTFFTGEAFTAATPSGVEVAR